MLFCIIMKQVDLRLAGAATHAYTLALTDFHDKNMYQKRKYSKTHVPQTSDPDTM